MRALTIAIMLVALTVPAAPVGVAAHYCDPEMPCYPHVEETLCQKPFRAIFEKFVPNLCY